MHVVSLLLSLLPDRPFQTVPLLVISLLSHSHHKHTGPSQKLHAPTQLVNNLFSIIHKEIRLAHLTRIPLHIYDFIVAFQQLQFRTVFAAHIIIYTHQLCISSYLIFPTTTAFPFLATIPPL